VILRAPRPLRAYLRWRALLPAGLLAGFYLLPWLQWDGHQAVLFDLPARRFDLFGLTLWPHDVGVLAGMLAVLAAGLMLLTHLAGRVWCGHACPQTLWSRLFGWLEQACTRLLPHPRLARAARQVLWAGVALWTGLTFVGLFSPIRALTAGLWPPHWSAWETFWILFYAAATWGNVGILRRQVCRDLCPFARMQAVLCDADTPRMHYDARRAEPRGPRVAGLGGIQARGRGLLDAVIARDYAFRAAHAEIAGPMPHFIADRLGDCLDCGACVRACPMALDIRSGPHAACIACGDCVDACDTQLRAWQFPPGLIGRASDNQVAQRRTRWLRPRTLAVAGVLLILLGLLLNAV
jgi:polyferredoxin